MAHNHTHNANKHVLRLSFFIITSYMLIEAIGGYLTNSLALLSDAGHMLSDSISLAIALLAFKLGEATASPHKTFGYKRFEILAAVFNGLTLIGIALFIFYEAIERFANPPEVATTGMLLISAIGLLVNLWVAYIMNRGGDTQDNLNMRGAFLHVLSDILGSVGAILAALLIIFFGWSWADPLASVFVALLVLKSGFSVTKDGIHVLMEGAPHHVHVDDIIHTLKNTPGIQSIHDLHIWTITSGLIALSCHAVVDADLSIAEGERLLHEIEHVLEHKGITHVTIQLETDAHNHADTVLCQVNSKTSTHHHNHH